MPNSSIANSKLAILSTVLSMKISYKTTARHHLQVPGVANPSQNFGGPNSPIMIPNRLKFGFRSSRFNRHLHKSATPIHAAVFPSSSSSSPLSSSSASTTSSRISSGKFSWDDVFRFSQSPNLPSGLDGFFDKVNLCNRGSEHRSEFIPFVIEDQIVGHVHKGLVNEHLRRFSDVFTHIEGNSYGSRFGHITLHSMLKTPESRTRSIGDVVSSLGEKVFPGIRNELLSVTSSFGNPVYFSLERAAVPYFGIKAYGVHMNGYVEKDGEKYLWIGKRSDLKSTYPGMLDHLVAGGLPHGISCEENTMKECEEEAGIPSSISSKVKPVGAVSYSDIEGYRYKRDVLFCYDLKLPESFVPENQDGEVGSFKLLPVTLVANIIRGTEFFKSNCNLVIIDFLFRHGYIKPEEFGYLKLLQSLRSGECS